MKLIIGTSGYSYDDWRGVFYPDKIAKGKMLDFYATQFNSVEVNSTYYKIPNPVVFARMAEKTPPNFEFVVKAHQQTTHQRRDGENAAKAIIDAVAPLQDQQKFSGFLLQFPYSFKNNIENRKYLAATRDYFKDAQLFVEFRHNSWQKPEVLDFLENNGISYVNVDQPALQGLLTPTDWVSNNLGYIRFHGRNEQNWWQGDNASRYDYAYSTNELNDWLIKISHILKKSFKTYIFFNNHPQGKAIQAARLLESLLQKQLSEFGNLS